MDKKLPVDKLNLARELASKDKDISKKDNSNHISRFNKKENKNA